MNIVDKSGVWLINTGDYAIFDGTSNTRFEPGEETKATLTAWVEAQPTLKRCAAPGDELSAKEQAKLDADNAAAEAKREELALAAEQARAAARGEPVEIAAVAEVKA